MLRVGLKLPGRDAQYSRFAPSWQKITRTSRAVPLLTNLYCSFLGASAHAKQWPVLRESNVIIFRSSTWNLEVIARCYRSKQQDIFVTKNSKAKECYNTRANVSTLLVCVHPEYIPSLVVHRWKQAASKGPQVHNLVKTENELLLCELRKVSHPSL